MADRCRPRAINNTTCSSSSVEAHHKTWVIMRSLVVGNASRAIETASAFLFHIAIRKVRKGDQHAWPIFSGIGFSHWGSNGRQSRLGEIQQGSSSCWRLRALAVSRALNDYRCSLLVVGRQNLMNRFFMGAIIAAFRKRFSHEQILFLLYALPLTDNCGNRHHSRT